MVQKQELGLWRVTAQNQTQGTENTHEKHRKHGNDTHEENNTTKKQHTTRTQTKHLRLDMIQGHMRHVQRPTRHLPFIHSMNRKAIVDIILNKTRSSSLCYCRRRIREKKNPRCTANSSSCASGPFVEGSWERRKFVEAEVATIQIKCTKSSEILP